MEALPPRDEEPDQGAVIVPVCLQEQRADNASQSDPAVLAAIAKWPELIQQLIDARGKWRTAQVCGITKVTRLSIKQLI
jgi:hypothetical protein